MRKVYQYLPRSCSDDSNHESPESAGKLETLIVQPVLCEGKQSDETKFFLAPSAKTHGIANSNSVRNVDLLTTIPYMLLGASMRRPPIASPCLAQLFSTREFHGLQTASQAPEKSNGSSMAQHRFRSTDIIWPGLRGKGAQEAATKSEI